MDGGISNAASLTINAYGLFQLQPVLIKLDKHTAISGKNLRACHLQDNQLNLSGSFA